MTLEELIRSVLNLPEEEDLNDDSGPGQPELWDSLAHAALMFELEATYNVVLDIGDIMSIETVADIKRMLDQKGAKGF